MSGHHLILGQVKDYLTGKVIEDNHDERLRQKIIKFLVEKKGYEKGSLKKDLKARFSFNNHKVSIPIDYTIFMNGRAALIVKYGPGSIITREKTAIAISRIMFPYLVPYCIVTNGLDAELINTDTGKVEGVGMESIPDKNELKEKIPDQAKKIEPKLIELAKKVIFAFEIHDRCPCDTPLCETENERKKYF